MEVVRTVEALRAGLGAWRAAGKTVALVPTMGALHAGHLALVAAARAAADRTAASIFVNPRQFGAGEDLARYPRRERQDREALAEAGCDLLFAPDADQIYPPGFATTVSVAGLTEGLCGAERPGHFDGVATVVAKLLNLFAADVAVFGEKDWQQLAVIRRLGRDLDIPTRILGVPTVREPDGLALSSRNAYLSDGERAAAPALYRALTDAAAAMLAGTPVADALAGARQALAAAGFRTHYVELRGAEALEPLARLDRPARLLAAASLGAARLIDNVPVDPPPPC